MTDWTPLAIAKLRQRANLTQEEFAREILVTTGTVSRWENGRVAPTKLAARSLDAFEAGLTPGRKKK